MTVAKTIKAKRPAIAAAVIELWLLPPVRRIVCEYTHAATPIPAKNPTATLPNISRSIAQLYRKLYSIGMNTLRSPFSRLFTYLAVAFLFFTANAFAFYSVIDRDTIKTTLKEEQVYTKLVPALLATARENNEALVTIDGVGSLPLQEEWVSQAAQTAFPATDLEQKGNTIVDATFDWLEGKNNALKFQLDFTQNKQQLGEAIGTYAEQRMTSLPRCTGNEGVVTEFNAFTSPCAPPQVMVNPASLKATIAQQVAADQDFLKDPIVTPQTISADPNLGQPSTSLDQTSGSAPPAYSYKTWFLWLLPISTLAFAALGIYLANDRAKALRQLGFGLVATAIGLLLTALVIGWGFKTALGEAQSDQLMTDILAPVLTRLAQEARDIYMIFTAIAVAGIIACFTVAKRLAAARAK